MLGVRSFYSQHRNETKISIQTGINSWQNSFPFTIYSGVDNSFSGVGSDRADFTGRNISQAVFGDRSHAQMVNQYFNTSLFTVNAVGTFGNAVGTFGNAPRNMLANPGLFNRKARRYGFAIPNEDASSIVVRQFCIGPTAKTLRRFNELQSP
jgi:hypothetical protein